MVMPAEQTPMAQKPVMMRGRRPTLSMVKHCQEGAETDGVLGSSKVDRITPEPQIQLKVGGCSQWHLGIGGDPSSEFQGWGWGMETRGEHARGRRWVPQSRG